MEVILVERLAKLGNVGDVVKVKNGFARNFLFPQRKALRATAKNKEVFEQQRAAIETQNAEKRAAAEKAIAKLEGLHVIIIRQAGDDGRLYGSVTTNDIAKLVSAAGKGEVTRQDIILHAPIKELGVYKVTVELYAGVAATVKVNVARTEAEAAEALTLFLNPPKAKAADEGDAEEAAVKTPKKKKAPKKAEEAEEAAE